MVLVFWRPPQWWFIYHPFRTSLSGPLTGLALVMAIFGLSCTRKTQNINKAQSCQHYLFYSHQDFSPQLCLLNVQKTEGMNEHLRMNVFMNECTCTKCCTLHYNDEKPVQLQPNNRARNNYNAQNVQVFSQRR